MPAEAAVACVGPHPCNDPLLLSFIISVQPIICISAHDINCGDIRQLNMVKATASGDAENIPGNINMRIFHSGAFKKGRS